MGKYRVGDAELSFNFDAYAYPSAINEFWSNELDRIELCNQINFYKIDVNAYCL